MDEKISEKKCRRIGRPFLKKRPGKRKVKTTKKAVRANPKATPRLCEILLVAESLNSDGSGIPEISDFGFQVLKAPLE